MHIHPDYILLEMDIIQWACWLKEFIHLPKLVQPNLSCKHFRSSPEIASGAIAVQAAAAAKDSSREGPRATPELRGRGVASGYPLWHVIFWQLHRDRMRSVYKNLKTWVTHPYTPHENVPFIWPLHKCGWAFLPSIWNQGSRFWPLKHGIDWSRMALKNLILNGPRSPSVLRRQQAF